MTRDDEYGDNMVTMLALIWGEGYMAPGGPGNVAKLLSGIETRGKRILDIGCGIGGPALEMAKSHGAQVVGIDLEVALIERATRSAHEVGLADRCSFQVVDAGDLPFADKSFDVVISSGAFTQTPDKTRIFAEAFRVLRPGGTLSSYDWLKGPDDYSEDMLYWFKMEELTYALETLEGFSRYFDTAGFVSVASEDATAWYREEARREYDLIKGGLNPRMVDLLGQKDADHFVENWRSLVVVIDNGEMRQGYCRGQRPT